MGKIYDVQEVMKYLPHRYPFILVDRILEIVPGEKIVALKNVTINEPFFQGHFPGNPIMPGVLVLEAMAQAGGVLVSATVFQDREIDVMYFMGMDKVKFRRPVVPGDQLILEMQLLKQRKSTVKMSGVANVDEKIVAQGEFMATLGEKE
jgi:beta-hydroxyacyl-ACP dehydratase FabZ